MPQLEKLSIFLASPSDVRQERACVREVIDEVNRTVAAHKGVFLDLVSSERAFPGYGKDGQAIINEQIGDMKQHDLFVGIMWNRIGTPTPRDISGTAEEFARAVKTLQRWKKPEVWFYFRQASANLKTQEELDQKAGVLKFRSKMRGKGLFSEYTTPQNFEKKFREHLVTWIHVRSKKARSASGRWRSSGAGSAGVSDGVIAATEGTAPERPSRPKPAIKASVKRPPAAMKSPGSWVMLDNHFYLAKSISTLADRSTVLGIATTTGEQIADLRSLHPGDFLRRREVAYAAQHEAGITQVQSVVLETSQRKTVFTVTLAPLPQINNRSVTEVSTRDYTTDQIAELRARLVLLGQPFPKEIEYLAASYQTLSAYSTTATSIQTLPQLWTSLHTQPRLFLPRAWLYAAYLLKTGNIVESILTLELGPIKDKKMRVKFRGRRARIYANREPVTIDVEGECALEAGRGDV
jgi:hypothetical protein